MRRVAVVAAFFFVSLCVGLAAMANGNARRLAEPAKEISARLIAETRGGERLGAIVPRRDLTARFTGVALPPPVLVTASDAYGLASVNQGTYPVKTVDAGRIWRIAGAVFQTETARGGGVGAIGAASADVAFGWGGIIPDSVVVVTTDGGAQWWSASLPGLVVDVGVEGGIVVANVYSRAVGAIAAWKFVVVGKRWKYLTTLRG